MHIKVRVKTSCRVEKIVKESDDCFVLSVKEKAERNMANEKVLEIMRKLHPGKSVRLVSGHHSQAKIIEIG